MKRVIRIMIRIRRKRMSAEDARRSAEGVGARYADLPTTTDRLLRICSHTMPTSTRCSQVPYDAAAKCISSMRLTDPDRCFVKRETLSVDAPE